jgi:alkylhydroperoxidase/carboxymuconolactone decarboxylase family protein YurZ/NADP-dependent 3-hydroxy acid dehydrogenase YdfG
MSTTIAIVGAGPGLGLALARRFGGEGHAVALISRRQEKLTDLVSQLPDDVTARGYAADVRDPEALTAALSHAAADLGPIEVLDYSPVPQREFLKPVLETSSEDISAAVGFSVLGPLAAVTQVLPGMRELGRGTILFVNGGSAATPNSRVGGTSVAFAAESAYARMLHETVEADGISVRQLIVPGAIQPGHPTHSPDALAERLWRLHTRPGPFREIVETGPATGKDASPMQRLLGDLAPTFTSLTDDVLFGQVWSRPDLSRRDRSLATISSLVSAGNIEQLTAHIPMGIRNGLSKAEVVEAITHVAFYAGWPRAVSALTVAREVFDREGNS